MPEKDTVAPIEKIPLRERLHIPLSEGSEPKAILKHPLATRIEMAMNGECFDDGDIAAYKEILKASAETPLSDLIEPEELAYLTEKKYSYLDGLDLEFPKTYGEAARLVASSWGEIAADGNAFDCDYLPDREYDIFFMLWDCLLTEFKRRNGTNCKELSLYKDLSGSFKAASIPLPAYFKAANAAYDEEGGITGEDLATLYRNRYSPLLAENPSLVRIVKSNLAKQPDKRTFYADPITMLGVLANAYVDSLISQGRYEALTYDIVILPYVFK